MPAKKWTLETVSEVAKLYKTRKEFQDSHKGAYLAAVRGKYLEDVCGHMHRLIRADLTEEQVVAIAKKYPTRREFQKGDASAYAAVLKNKWVAAFSHMELLRKHRKKDEIAAVARSYRTRTEFAKGSWADYLWAKRRGWLEEVCEGMEVDQHAPYSKEEVAEAAKRYTTRSDFQRGAPSHYSAALKNGWLAETCAHMRRARQGFNPEKGGWLYHIKFLLNKHTTVYKVGITNTPVEKRIRHMRVPNHILFEVTHAIWHDVGSEARAEEKRLLTIGKTRGDAYQGDPFLDTGNTELFYSPLM